MGPGVGDAASGGEDGGVDFPGLLRIGVPEVNGSEDGEVGELTGAEEVGEGPGGGDIRSEGRDGDGRRLLSSLEELGDEGGDDGGAREVGVVDEVEGLLRSGDADEFAGAAGEAADVEELAVSSRGEGRGEGFSFRYGLDGLGTRGEERVAFEDERRPREDRGGAAP